MESNVSADIKSEDDELESKKAQEVIGLLLSKPDDSNEAALQHVDFTDSKITQNISNSGITVSIAGSSPLNICHVSLTEAGMLLESGDIIQQPLDGTTSSLQLEDGATLIQNYETNDDCDSSDAVAKFIDGQAVQLEDGSTAFIHAVPREGLQAVQLEDGTMAYLSQSSGELFNGEASSLENLSSSQVSDGEGKEYDMKGSDSFDASCSKGTSCRALEKAFRCPYEGCRRLYTTYHHLKVHERSHTGDRPFKCPMSECGKAFATGYGLKSHIRVHTGETPYKCAESNCHKAFKTSGDLQKHLRTHTGERPFKCPYSGCDRAFTTSNIRKVHIRTHTGERPYVCKQVDCGRAFASATNYKNHIRIHTGEKPYVCSVSGCNKRFTEYSSLYKHHVVHTHSKPYICNICGKTYRQTSTLAMHKRTSHGIVDASENDAASHLEVEVAETAKIDVNDSTIEKPDSPKEKEESNECSKSANDEKLCSKETTVVTSSCPTVVTLQGASSQILQEHPVYTVQVQDDGTLSTTGMQQFVLVTTDPEQLAALQQLAQQGQLESVLAITEQNSATEES